MPYRTLRADSISKTLERLEARIRERFPSRGLTQVCAELAEIGRQTDASLARIDRPNWWARLTISSLFVFGLATLAFILSVVKLPNFQSWDVFVFLESTDAFLNVVVVTGAGIFFLMRWEENLKRQRILAELHKLRSIIHVVDMHQLTKDPTPILNPHLSTKSSPVRDDMSMFQLNRYLDYCSEMLSLAAKLAALYAQNMRDPVVIAAVNEIESLASSLSWKIWQKIIVIRQESGDGAPFAASPPAPASEATQ